MFAAAKALGYVMERLNQPAVVGEILDGVIIGPSVLGLVQASEFIDILAELAVIVLLFRVGLEVNLKDMMEVGLLSLGVAVVGVVLSFIVGVGLVSWVIYGVLLVVLFFVVVLVAI